MSHAREVVTLHHTTGPLGRCVNRSRLARWMVWFCATCPVAEESLLRGAERDSGSPSTAPTLLRWWDQSEEDVPTDPDEPLATDRPDFTEASSTVGRDTLQVELGYTHTFDREGAETTRSHSYPETLFRYGVFADWLELRLAQNVASETAVGSTAHGAEDLYLGAKLALTKQSGLLPEVAVMPQMTLPTGGPFSSDAVLPGVNLLYGWDVNDWMTTAGSTQFNRAIESDSGEAYTEWAQSWTIGYSLTDQLGAYTEWFAFIPHSAVEVRPQHYFDAGLTYQFTPNLQWDVRAGVGLNSAADDGFVGTGLAFRWR